MFLGRFGRASASIESLVAEREKLGANARAQLLGLEADLATRMGEAGRGARLYEQSAVAWEAQGRAMDAAEARLESLLLRARETQVDASQLGRELEALRKSVGDAGFREHEALAEIVRGTIANHVGDETMARAAFDAALDHATRARSSANGRGARSTRRAQLLASQGSVASARRDTEQALSMLEETAAKLPRDLREVFWDDPRRRALRQAHTATLPMPISSTPYSPYSPYAPSAVRTFSQTRASGMSSGNTTMGAPLPADDRLARIFEIHARARRRARHGASAGEGHGPRHRPPRRGAQLRRPRQLEDGTARAARRVAKPQGDDPHAQLLPLRGREGGPDG